MLSGLDMELSGACTELSGLNIELSGANMKLSGFQIGRCMLQIRRRSLPISRCTPRLTPRSRRMVPCELSTTPRIHRTGRCALRTTARRYRMTPRSARMASCIARITMCSPRITACSARLAARRLSFAPRIKTSSKNNRKKQYQSGFVKGIVGFFVRSRNLPNIAGSNNGIEGAWFPRPIPTGRENYSCQSLIRRIRHRRLRPTSRRRCRPDPYGKIVVYSTAGGRKTRPYGYFVHRC